MHGRDKFPMKLSKLKCPLCNTELKLKTMAPQENTAFGMAVSVGRLDFWKCLKPSCGWWCPCSVDGKVMSPKPLSSTSLDLPEDG